MAKTSPLSRRAHDRRHRRLVYDLLFDSASRTLIELGEKGTSDVPHFFGVAKLRVACGHDK
jgi:hypothetical protein